MKKFTNPIIKFKKLTEKAISPVRATPLAAGLDIASAYDYIIPPGGKELVSTDLAVNIPENCYGRIAPRSGISWKHSIHVGAGVIDADYRGHLKVLLFNLSNEKSFTITAGM